MRLFWIIVNNYMPDEETIELMDNYDLDRDEAEHIRDIMDEYSINEDEAIELKDEL